MDRDGVASYLGVSAVGFLIGTLTSGAVADWLGRRGIDLLTVMTGFVLVYLLAMAAVTFQIALPTAAMWFVFGMFGQAGILSYPWMASHFGAGLAGRANAAMNFLVFGTAFACQYVVGAIIDLWPESSDGTYAPEAYMSAFGLFLAIQLACLAWFLVNRPTTLRGS